MCFNISRYTGFSIRALLPRFPEIKDFIAAATFSPPKTLEWNCKYVQTRILDSVLKSHWRVQSRNSNLWFSSEFTR